MGTVTRVMGMLNTEITLRWVDLQPVTQVYGILFNDQNEVLVLRRPDGRATLPGGKPEAGETMYQTLEREAMEEANVKVEDLQLLGANRVEDLENPDPKRKVYFQLRLIGHIAEELKRQVDPATGEIMQKEYYPLEELNKVLGWGENGEGMVAAAKIAQQAHGR